MVWELLYPARCAACHKLTRGEVFCDCCHPSVLTCERTCEACGRPLPDDLATGEAALLTCAACLTKPGVVTHTGWAWEYGGAVRQAIVRLKYGGQPHLARRLVDAAIHDLGDWPILSDNPRWDAVVPVPLHSRRLAQRGFNQSALIARALAKPMRCKVAPRALRRVRPTDPQASLTRAARLKNVAGAFRARRRMPGARLLIVDDVYTTGATTRACAKALKRAGAAEIGVFALARDL